jgi:Brp/Blh family beta-carotene 15,15'-monooxygenase
MVAIESSSSLLPRDKVVTVVLAAPVIALMMLVTLFLTDSAWQHIDLVAFAAVGLLAGLPHGAVDLFLELGPNGVPRGRTLVAQVAVYVLVVAVALAVILWQPVLGVGVFIAISLWHFGSADAAFNAYRHDEKQGIALVETFAYGAPLTVMLFVRWPDEVRQFIDPLGGSGVTTALIGPARIVLAAAVVALTVTVVRKAVRRQGVDVFELILLWVSALVLPPLASFPIYFALWHSPRHVLRTLPQLPASRSDLAAGRVARSLLRYGLYTVPFTLCALALFVALIVINHSFSELRPSTWAGALLAALTMPHAVAIFRYDLWLNRR